MAGSGGAGNQAIVQIADDNKSIETAQGAEIDRLWSIIETLSVRLTEAENLVKHLASNIPTTKQAPKPAPAIKAPPPKVADFIETQIIPPPAVEPQVPLALPPPPPPPIQNQPDTTRHGVQYRAATDEEYAEDTVPFWIAAAAATVRGVVMLDHLKPSTWDDHEPSDK